MYSFQLSDIISRNLPHALRKPRVLAWLKNLTYPLTIIDSDFSQFRDEIDEKYDWNGLKHSLEWLLNDRYDPVLRRIYIVVHETPAVAYWIDDYELGDTLWIDDHEMASLYWMDEEDYNAIVPIDYEFTIRVWPGIEIDVQEVLDLVNRYRFAGLRPRVVWYGDMGEIDPNGPSEFDPG